MKVLIVATVVLLVPLRSAEITFEAWAEDTSPQIQARLREFYLDSYDAFTAVLREGKFQWQDAKGTHEVVLNRARLVADVPTLRLQVVFAEEPTSAQKGAISEALEAAAWQRYHKRFFAQSALEAEVFGARVRPLIAALESERDATRKRILGEVLDALGSRTDCEPKFFGLRTWKKANQAVQPTPGSVTPRASSSTSK